MIEKFKSSPVQIYLPRLTLDLYLDIIENRVMGNSEYNIYTI
jgi:hypothetical protein